jgi:flagellar protein FlaF
MPRLTSAYEETQRDSLEGRALEVSVLTRANRKLIRCQQMWEKRGTPEFQDALDDALAFTQRLWSFLQVELSNPEHPMPRELRLDLLRLSNHIDRSIMRLYSGGSVEDLRVIARITQEIAAGLSTEQQN